MRVTKPKCTHIPMPLGIKKVTTWRAHEKPPAVLLNMAFHPCNNGRRMPNAFGARNTLSHTQPQFIRVLCRDGRQFRGSCNARGSRQDGPQSSVPQQGPPPESNRSQENRPERPKYDMVVVVEGVNDMRAVRRAVNADVRRRALYCVCRPNNNTFCAT